MKLKRRAPFYAYLVLWVLLGVWGSQILRHGVLSYRSPVLITGFEARIFGGLLLASSLYLIWHLIFRSQKEELSKTEFKELKDFVINVDGFTVEFTKGSSFVTAGQYTLRHIPAVEYVLTIPMEVKGARVEKIEPEGRFRSVLRKLGVKCKANRQTQIENYVVKCSGESDPVELESTDLAQVIRWFALNKVPIRLRPGRISLESGKLEYIEGPYDENTRLFDPHRGKIEEIAARLVDVAKELNTVSNKSVEATSAIASVVSP